MVQITVDTFRHNGRAIEKMKGWVKHGKYNKKDNR